MGNMIVLAALLSMHWIASKGTGGNPWRVYFPALTLAVVVFLSQGCFFFATELIAESVTTTGVYDDSTIMRVAAWALAVGGYAAGLTPFIAVAKVQWQWGYLEEQPVYTALEVARAPLRQRLIFFFTSASYWTPTAVAKCWGSVFAMYHQESRWFHFVLLGTNAITAIILGMTRSEAACTKQVTAITLLYALQLFLILYLRPFRQPFLQVLSVVTCLLRSVEMTALAIVVWSKQNQSDATDSAGFALHLISDASLVLLTFLCAVSVVLDRLHIAPVVKIREESLLSSVSRMTEELDGYVIVESGGLLSRPLNSLPTSQNEKAALMHRDIRSSNLD